ncbi:uncharacterized protein LOC106137791 [Amyelois transitella]|uniref:uncharacterized protein LOC106137791 n=1 Tax=Amyelois transitella TaxID=680683 RepID=UPI00298FD3D3|nr:uncharacterized protein LOC106137791 [Amyelois transitella]
MSLRSWKTALCASGPVVVCGIVIKILRRNIAQPISKIDINEILIYGSEDERRMIEIGLDNLYCIHYVLAHANQSIDVCVPSLESDTIADCLINVQERSKAMIRVVIHNSKTFNHLNPFSKCGIQVKVVQTAERMEHEFILIDASEDSSDAVAVIGSLDYQTTRVNCNRDITLLTSDISVVTVLKREFDRVWNSVQIDLENNNQETMANTI